MNILRRNDLSLNSTAELAIYNAINEVEKLGADVQLTKVVMLLSEAKNVLGDFIDKNENKGLKLDKHEDKRKKYMSALSYLFSKIK